MNLGRLARTVAALHPLQLATRAPHVLVGKVVRDVPRAMAPRTRSGWSAASEALRRFANAERLRGAERLASLPAESRLRAYEARYGLELGADESVPAAEWSSPVAVEAYPASVRARRIAVAIRCGRRGLEPELARAARAVLLQPELHLLGNHLLENGFALACAGAAAVGPEADAWWGLGRRLLEWQLPAQFLADGGHIERSASYHLGLVGALLETLELAEASGRSTPRGWRSTAARGLGWARAVRAPDGMYPLFNDAALDAAPRIEDVLALGAGLGIGPVAVTEDDGVGRLRVARLDPTGWVRLDAGDACLFVDAGPDAEGWQPGHAHADGLTFEAWVRGIRTVVDFGVASYQQGAAREATRGTRSHNTVELDGIDSCEVWGAFRLGRRGRAVVTSYRASEGGVTMELAHDGYSRMPGAPRHIRRLEVRTDGLALVDRLPGARQDWSSRLRFDADAFGSVRVVGAAETRQRADVWYPRHGQERAAVVLEQLARPFDQSLRWDFGW